MIKNGKIFFIIERKSAFGLSWRPIFILLCRHEKDGRKIWSLRTEPDIRV